MVFSATCTWQDPAFVTTHLKQVNASLKKLMIYLAGKSLLLKEIVHKSVHTQINHKCKKPLQQITIMYKVLTADHTWWTLERQNHLLWADYL